ncbi:MAG: serine/threonine protein kinase [Gemmatimonadota bacterium]|nr:serine/threonine protein kinase [Gemmatimonadota bacterium]
MASELDPKTTLVRAADPSSRSGRRTSTSALPPDLLAAAAGRLRVSALMYAAAYFLSAFLPALLFAEGRAVLFSSPEYWLPGTLSLAGALAVAWLVSRPELSDPVKLRAGLSFEVLGSFGIAAAQYHDIAAPISQGLMGAGGFGLSWVAVWVLLFNVMVPTPPRTAVAVAAVSVTAVPLTYAAGVALGRNVPLDPASFFFSLVSPYVVVVLLAYFGARIVYGLGTAVRRARELGSYSLVERLGRGGMGEVWRARHRMLARPAAIKLIRPEVLGWRDDESRQLLLRRFEREAQATALMRSEHTMELYDFGVADDGTFYYVMELLDGFDLDELVERFGPLPAERVVHLLLQICASLGEAHEAGLIHRDVKPANLYLCRYGREVDFIKVLDFGLVKHGRMPEESADKLTGADVSAGGTPAFMSPEQALGEERVDGSSDLYSMGCVAYWLLTGTLVFKGATPMETMVMHISRQPEPPSARTTLPIPGDLEALVLACLAKDPDARPQTADELAARLASVPLAGEWTTSLAREWWDRHRPAVDRERVVEQDVGAT